ncbi:MAG: MFS transporter [Acidimicrobiia bacterium]
MAARIPPGLLAALLLVDFTDEWCSTLLPVATPAIRADLGLSYAEAGLLLGLIFGGGIVGGVATAAADFVSRRALAGAGAVVYGLCMLAFGFSDEFVVLAISAFIWGAASDAFVHGAELALADLAGDDLEPTLATVNFLGAFGTVLAPIVLSVSFVTGASWRVPFVAGGVLAIGYGVVLASLSLPRPQGDGDEHTPLRVVRAVLRDPLVRRLAFVELISESLDLAFLGFMAVYLEQARGFSSAAASALLAVVLGGTVVGFAFVAAARLRPGVGTLRPAALVEAVAILGIIVLPGWFGVALGGLVFGISGAFWWVAFQAAVLRARPTQTGTTWAVVSYLSLPALLAAPAAGYLADRYGVGAAMALFPTLAAVAVLAAPGPGRGRTSRLRRWPTRFSLP